jgi:hypothetical protein
MKEDDAAFANARHSGSTNNMSVLQSLRRGLSETLRAAPLERPGNGLRRRADPPPRQDGALPTAAAPNHRHPVLGNPAASDAARRRRDLAATLSVILDEVLRDLAEDGEQGREAPP